MQHVLIVFNILFFATGFMGVTALALLKVRLQSRLLGPLLVFQSLFLAGMGLIVVYFYLAGLIIGRVISGCNRKTADERRDFAKHDNDRVLLACRLPGGSRWREPVRV